MENIILNNKLNLDALLKAKHRPELFPVAEEPFWDDPHISQQMLEAHLNPDSDAASYRHKTIEQIVEWLVSYLTLINGASILDLGCGPGLYCTRFYQHGLDVVGMDYSRNSINFAQGYAAENHMDIRYVYRNYLTMDFNCEFDAIFLISCDFGALSDTDRDILLKKVYRALKPGGVFVFDAFTGFNWNGEPARNWYSSKAGFWRPCPHLVLEQTFHYQKENVFLRQYNVIDSNGKVAEYNIWDHYYSRDTVSQLMREHGYQVREIWSDLTGKPYEDDTGHLGVVAGKL